MAYERLVLDPLDLVLAAPWRRVAFTTFALSLSFFEAVVLDAMVRAGARDAIVFADPLGVKAALSEHGARRVGREYEVEPIACLTGAFHPKLSIFSNDTDCHVTVGSGNLTFGGWGGNAELIEHLHPSFAGDAFDDLADMLELLTISENIRTGASENLFALANDLRKGALNSARTGNIRVVHSVGGSIADSIRATADELGGATNLTVASPYFDRSGHALQRLANDLGLSSIALHVHPRGPVRGSTGLNWPGKMNGLIVPMVIEEGCFTSDRLLHAKAFELICRRGRILVSGSANATIAGLYAGNVEASVMRVQRDTLVGWKQSHADHPKWTEQDEKVEDNEEPDLAHGVLRAVLNGPSLTGMILTPRINGPASLYCTLSTGKIDLGSVTVDNNGNFSATAVALEEQSWLGGRLIIGIEQGVRRAEGFLSLTAAAEIMRRAGPLGPRLMAMLAGTETPEDVAVILSWFREDSRRLDTGSTPAVGLGAERSPVSEPIFVPISLNSTVHSTQYAAGTLGSIGEPAWRRAMLMILSAFAVRRGPWEVGESADSNADDDESEGETPADREKRSANTENSKRKANDAFIELLDVMLLPENNGRHVLTALAIAHYLAERNGDSHLIDLWLRRIVPAASSSTLASSPLLLTAAVIMFSRISEWGAVHCRRFLLRLGVEPSDVLVDPDAAPAFSAILGPENDLSKFIKAVSGVRTPGEQVQLYLDSFNKGPPHDGFPVLQRSAEWPQLNRALTDPGGRARLRVHSRLPESCPDCHMVFSRASIGDMRQCGVTRCCRINLCTEL